MTSLALGAGASIAVAADTAGTDSAIEPRFGEVRAEQPMVRNWTLIIGAGGLVTPEYEGSDKLEVGPLPLFLFTYGDWLEVDPTGAELKAFEYRNLSFSSLVGYETGRDEDDDDILDGLGDIDFAPTVGGQVAYEFGPFELYATLEKTIGGSDGLVGRSGLVYAAPASSMPLRSPNG